MPVSMAELRTDVAVASAVVAPSWPLSSTIAVNPLSGFEDQTFAAALGEGAARFGARGHLTLAEFRAALAAGRVTEAQLGDALTRRVPNLDAGEVSILMTDLLEGPEMPPPDRWAVTIAEQFDRDHGTQYRAQLDLEISDWCAQWAVRSEPGDLWTAWRADAPPFAQHLSSDPSIALSHGLEILCVPESARCDYLERHLAALAGWAAHLRWRQEHTGGDVLLGHLARCVTLEAHLLGGLAWFRPEATIAPEPPETDDARVAVVACSVPEASRAAIRATVARLPEHERALVWLDAYEHAVHDPLLLALDRPPVEHAGGPLAHVVCCIDVRSEGLRRHLEAQGDYRTYGYAGFFGLAASMRPLTGGASTEQYPVLLSAAMELAEVPVAGGDAGATAVIEHARVVAGLDDAWRAAKYHPLAPLALAEGAGWLAGPVAAARTATPRLAAWIADRLPHERVPAASTTFDRSELPVETQAALVAGVLRLGIGGDPAPLVVLCGHAARVDNQPLESGLACGACGGNGGAPNARIVTAMANDPAVRAELAAAGTPIPDETWFVAAVHDTPTDRVTLLDLDRVPAMHADALAQLRADLDRAGDAAALERADTLPGACSTRSRALGRVRGRARDWAEPVAELGLAGNMAFIVGPRSMTKGLELGRRVFLHSYDAAADPHGAVLGGILTAPLVVAQWINSQYNLSTTDPEIFGAGSKAVHNVLGDVGLLSGAGGDLRRGLPLQSVRVGDQLLHEPVRLMAVVQGRPEHIDATLAESVTLRHLVEHEWISIVARSGPAAPWQQRTHAGWVERPVGEPQSGRAGAVA